MLEYSHNYDLDERKSQYTKLQTDKRETERISELTKFFKENGFNYDDMIYVNVEYRPKSTTYYYNVVDKKIYAHEGYFHLEHSHIEEATEENSQGNIFSRLKEYVKDNFQ